MTTLEERRAWVQAGCPIHEVVHPRPPCPDDAGFLIEAWPGKSMLTAYCQWCNRMAGMRGETFRHSEVLIRPRRAIRLLCPWMDEHAGNPTGMAERALTVRQVVGVSGWADVVMRGNVVPELMRLSIPGSDQFYLLDPSPSYAVGDDARHALQCLNEPYLSWSKNAHGRPLQKARGMVAQIVGRPRP